MEHLGKTMVDKVSGYTGIAMVYVTHDSGMDRLGIQPVVGEDGKLPDSYTFDKSDLEVVENGKSIEVLPISETTPFNFGDKVRDKYSDLEGIIVAKYVYANGCVHYGVQQPVNKEGKFMVPVKFSSERLVLKKAVKTEAPVVKTGGPIERFTR